MKIFITGGCGFVGSFLAVRLREQGHEVSVLDNLKRRGSELNLPRLKAAGVRFFHGDIRMATDLEDVPGQFDVMIEASAEPSVLAGLSGAPHYLLQTNLSATLHCLEMARQRCGGILFLSTSRVYSMANLRDLPLAVKDSRLDLDKNYSGVGVSYAGIDRDFETRLPRSLYGASKLASELLVQEYADTYSLPAIINRCGVIAGPGQFGKVDQGVFTLWVANHILGLPLGYLGFGGKGQQVRDLLHPADLFSLMSKQMDDLSQSRGEIYNVGGGREGSVSLAELTDICREVTGRETPLSSREETSKVDIPWYITDNTRVSKKYSWQPTRTPQNIVKDIRDWFVENQSDLEPLFR